MHVFKKNVLNDSILKETAVWIHRDHLLWLLISLAPLTAKMSFIRFHGWTLILWIRKGFLIPQLLHILMCYFHWKCISIKGFPPGNCLHHTDSALLSWITWIMWFPGISMSVFGKQKRQMSGEMHHKSSISQSSPDVYIQSQGNPLLCAVEWGGEIAGCRERIG